VKKLLIVKRWVLAPSIQSKGVTRVFSNDIDRLIFFHHSQRKIIFSCQLQKVHRGTVASVVIQAIGSMTNEENLMKATHPMIRLGQFGACTKLV